MKNRWYIYPLLLAVLVIPWGVDAQQQDEDDGGFLTRTIEDALSGAGREVNIVGFAGALSSEASFERMTIADDQGIWLTLEDVRLNWSRLALLRGNLEVDRLSAASLDLPRLPDAEETTELPSAEATEFALPDLPVSIDIALFEVARISLGEPIIGVAAELSVTAAARLDDAGAVVDLSAERLDGPEGMFLIKGGFARDTSEITVQLELDEAPEGLAVRMMKLPGQPSMDLTVAGAGLLDDFTADITLATDGEERVAGQVTLAALPGETEGAPPDRRIRAALGGDITPLVAPQSRDFFGSDIGLNVDVLRSADGALDISDFRLIAKSAQLAGAVRLNSDLWPTFVDVDGRIGGVDGQAVSLPGPDVNTSVKSVDLSVDFDVADGDAFLGDFTIAGLERDDLRFAGAKLVLDGALRGDPGGLGSFEGDLGFIAQGLALADANAGDALGQEVRGTANIRYVEDEPIEITGLELAGDDYRLAGDAVIDGLGGGFPTDLNLSVQADEIGRFSGVAGRRLAGAARLDVAGRVTPLSSMFDVTIKGTTTDLKVDVPQADAVLEGVTALTLQARRDVTGTFVEDLELANTALNLTGDVQLRSNNSAANILARLNDIARVLPQYEGAVNVDARASQDASGWTVDLLANAPYDSTLSVQGRATGPQADLAFDLSVPEIRPLAPSVQGPLNASGRLWQSGEGYSVDVDADGPYRSVVSVAGLATGPAASLDFEASLPDISVFVPRISGPFAIDGTARRSGPDWDIDTMAQGPSGTEATIAGLVREDGVLDLSVVGALPLGLSEPFLAPRSLQGQAQFDLAVNGPAALQSVSGRITTNDASFTAPNLRAALNNIVTGVNLADGRAQLDVTGDVVGGGQVVAGGVVNLATLVADLNIGLRSVVLTDPRIFSTTVDGDIAVVGGLTGGARIDGVIDVGETLISVPSSGLTSIGEIPDIVHIGSPVAVTQTRTRAGVIPQPEATAGRGAGSVYGLGIVVNAPRRIFVRGRGIDAELGGSLEISGNTGRVISAGQFDLVRGRLDILGKRFDLDEGSIQFQGDLVPYIRFVTTSDTETGTASIVLEGPVDRPEVTFRSTPEGPQDEVLAQLLFGRSLSEISAFQAVQLANAVAVLAGRSGAGLIGNLRTGFRLDDFDVTTTDEGEAAVRAGKYITDDIYTDVVTGGGETELSINLDISESLTARGTLENDGNTGIGLFFERDY
ncbi:translocation/assembly module TamB domain-containing protein [Roseobacter sp. YSTF-M11]|uniref:Translocation/assembly module TamB domain-containing protein n=1 Tax=Roseobacter insulae TaxID=2859783 RepID=A0A9X1FZW8_9RHOB|nr:translocation/assembly module TamB domain-containing protein [Roseobacter insulae]MBW4710673.1 translocation/assembly module TamB domain-containing protein [Roseobacter insulae]